jgi:hypothetical protein
MGDGYSSQFVYPFGFIYLSGFRYIYIYIHIYFIIFWSAQEPRNAQTPKRGTRVGV